MAKEDDARYDTYQSFLREAIRSYWDSRKAHRVNFMALLLASRESWAVAWEGARAPGTGKKLLKGAAGAAAVAVLIRVLLGGPIGILLTGASVVSLVALYVKNHKDIWARVGHYKDLIDSYERRYATVRDDYVDGDVDKDQLHLMLDGLMTRFLAEIDEFEPQPGEDDEEDADERSDFERHRDDRRAEEDAQKIAEQAVLDAEAEDDDDDDDK